IDGQVVAEGQTLVVQAAASDSDWPLNTLTFSLEPGAPTGATIDPATGVLSWTPTEQQGPGVYDLTVRVTDDGVLPLSDTTTFTVTVDEVNVVPRLDPIAYQIVAEGQTLLVETVATDADMPADTLTFTLEPGAPAGLTIDPATGELRWTPTEEQGPAVYDVTIRVTDDDALPLSDTETFRITVGEVNLPPVLDPIEDQTVVEGQTLLVVVHATDADLPGDSLSFSLESGAPSGAAIGATSGEFTWTPTEADGPGLYQVTVRVTDDGTPALSDTQAFTITVDEENLAPTLAPITDQTIVEGQTLLVQAVATDADLPANALTYQIELGLQAGMAIDPQTGQFTWTPAETHGPGTYAVTIGVSDNADSPLGDTATFSITVDEGNQPPELDPIADQTIVEGQTFFVQAVATDGDVPADTLTYSLESGTLAGMTIDPMTGEFTWAPTETQGPGSYVVTIRATDDDPSPLSDTETFTITVGELNDAPHLDPIGDQTIGEGQTLVVQAHATDADLPADTLTYLLGAGAVSGMTIDPVTGQFRWTPTEAQGPGSYAVTIRVRDDGSPSLEDATTVTISVDEVNQAPVLDPIADQTAVEGQTLLVQAVAADADLPANGLIYRIESGLQTGMTIDPQTGRFTWTPTEPQGPASYEVTIGVSDDADSPLSDTQTFTITVGERNEAPQFDPIAVQTVAEQQTLVVQTHATDPDLPADTLTYSLASGAMAGMTIDSVTGEFRWMPTEAQGPGSYDVTIRVRDAGTPSLEDTTTMTITVGEVNQAPVLDPIADRTVDEGQTLVVQPHATDLDLPANSLTFSLDAGTPAGMTINAATGRVTWTPTESQGPGTYDVTVRVTDNGTPSRADTETWTITVHEVNQAPVLDPIADRMVAEGQTLVIDVTADDSQDAGDVLSFALDSGVPSGATIDSTSGRFTWTPTESQGPGTYDITVRVTDSGSPPESDTATFRVAVEEVNQTPVLDPIADQTIEIGQTLSLTAKATDPDLPANTLYYSLELG
ncbi:MAG TPA: putative Ig domain-containing protein, partial [Thermoguttaceae bacterium]|nr:putative Ig domain-containing protein [Thermoguttaceae bacterium]